ncbi:hypothetical protein TKK_0011662 [Trichogramma kaykai]
MSETKYETTPGGKGTRVPKSTLGSYRVKAPVADACSLDSVGSKNREFRKTTGQGEFKKPVARKSLLPVVVVEKAVKETQAERERRLRKDRISLTQPSGASNLLVESGAAAGIVRSRSGSDKGEFSLTSPSGSDLAMEFTEESAKRTRSRSEELERSCSLEDIGSKRIRPDNGGGEISGEPINELAEIYSLDPRVQNVISNNIKKKSKVGLSQPAPRQVDPVTEMSELMDNLALYMARDEAKIAKFATAQVGIRVRKMRDLVTRLVVENAALRTRLEEKEEVAERLWTAIESGAIGEIGHRSRPDAAVPKGGQAKDTREKVPIRKPTYAVVLQGSGEMGKGQLQNSLKELSNSVTARVEKVKEMRGGKVMMELATEEDRQALLRDQRLKDLGIKAQKERKFPPLVEVKGIDRDMVDDRLLEEIWQRNLVEDVPAHEFEGRVRVKMKIGRKDKERCSVVLEVSPRIRDVMLNKGKVFVGWEAHKVSIFEKTLRCLKCYGFSHKVKDCKKQASCGNCGEEGHLRKDCTNGVGCAVCKEKGEKGEHSTWSETCPETRRRRQKWREKTE